MSQQKIKNDEGSKRLIYLAVLAITFIAAYIYTFDSKLAMLGDNASYYILGKALAQGEGYSNIFKVNHTPNNHYPPGYPVIISVVMLFTDSITAIKIITGLFFMLGLWLVFEVLRKLTDNLALSFAITFLTLINSHLLYYSSIMMSEIPFLFFSMLSIWGFIKMNHDEWSWKDPYMIICIVSLIMSYYIRSLGVALLGGYFLHFIVYRRWKGMLTFFVAFVAGALPWFIRSQKLGGGSYMKQLTMINPYQPALGKAELGDFVDRFFNNFSRYITYEIPSAIFPLKQPEYGAPYSGADWVIGILVLGILFYGIFSLPKYRWLIAGYVLGTLAILMIWPDVWIGVRFIVPMIPVFILGFFYGVFNLLVQIRKVGSFQKSISPYWLLVFALLYVKPVNAVHDQAKVPLPSGWKNYFEIARWVNRNADEKVVVGCGKPSLFYLYADTYTMRYKFAQDPKELIADLEKNKVDYVVIDQVYGNTLRYLLPAVRQYPERFEQVYHLKNPDTFLLKFKR